MIGGALGAVGFAIVMAGCQGAHGPGGGAVQWPALAAPIEDAESLARDRKADQARIRDIEAAEVRALEREYWREHPGWEGEVTFLAGPVPIDQEYGDLVAATPPWWLRPEAVTLSSRLAEMGYFALGGIGVGGTTSTGESTARALAALPTAVDSAEWLVAHGGPAGRLYGYWILRHRDPHRARLALTRLRRDTALVTVAAGCGGGTSSVGIEARALDLYPGPRP